MKLQNIFTKTNIEWFLGLIRPKIYNKITLWIVGAGLASLLTPFWAEPLLAYFNKTLDLNLRITNAPVVGLALIVIGIVFNILSQILELARLWFEKAESVSKKNHDLAIVKMFELIMNEENLKSGLDRLGGNAAYECDWWNDLHQFRDTLQRTSSRLLIPELENRRLELIQYLEVLGHFVAVNFFTGNHGVDDDQRYLRPDFNCDKTSFVDNEGIAYFRTKLNDLNGHIQKVIDAYEAYRLSIKTNLHY